MSCPVCNITQYVCVKCKQVRDATDPHCRAPGGYGFICGPCYEPPFTAIDNGTRVIRSPKC